MGLVRVTVAELGFPNGETRREIYARALKLGLELCPSEVGPQLRLQYSDQPKGEWVIIGMEPITDSGGYSSVFYVVRDGAGLWLNGYSGHPEVFFWDDSGHFVFVRRK